MLEEYPRYQSTCTGSVASRQSVDPAEHREGNGKAAAADRRRYSEIARGSGFECAAIQDVLVVGKVLNERKSDERKVELDRMAAMLSRLGARGYCIEEAPLIYGGSDVGIEIEPPWF